MKPETKEIQYYEGDTFTLAVFPRDGSQNYIPLGTIGANHPYFRIANKRGDNPEVHFVARADITQLVEDGPWCILCNITTSQGQQISNGFVYDIGYHLGDPPLDRVTVLTGTFLVMDEVKELDLYVM